MANAETLRMIIWEGYFPEKHRVKFKEVVKKKYGKELEFQISFISDAQEFFSALRTKKVDIISPTHNLLKDERFNFIKKGLLIPIDLDNVPNSRYLMPGLKSVAYHTENGKMYAMPYANGPYGLAYNTGKIKKAPKSWKVLLDPKYSKKYTIVADYSEVNIYIAALAAGVNPDRLTSFRSVNTPRVNEILRRLRRNAGSFWNGVDKPSDLKGKTLATSWGFSFAELAKQGEIWKFAEPKEGSPWWVDNFSISWTLADKPELKRIAEELINYLISPEFQLDNVVGSLSAVPVNMKTPLTREQKRSYHMDDDAKTFVKRRILWPTLSKRTRNGFSKMWERAGE
ncbi:MAG: extracellular solute-binding protein [Proteobacteria bacterium]|nr:extracellular solute-binding protein [Pseudomonadota bacterium]